MDDPLDLLPEPDDDPLPLDEPLPEPDPLPDPDPEADPLADPDPELCAVSTGMSLWTHTPSAENVFVPGMWMATVRVGDSTRSTVSTSSSASRSPIR